MSAWESSKVVAMQPGATETLGELQVTLTGVRMLQGPNYQAEQATFLVRHGSHLFELSSERRAYPVSGSQTTEAGIHVELLRNTYVAIGEPIQRSVPSEASAKSLFPAVAKRSVR